MLMRMGFYFVISIMIYSVVMKVAKRHGKPAANAEKGAIALALIWPLWGEFAVAALAIYILYKGIQLLNGAESQRGTR